MTNRVSVMPFLIVLVLAPLAQAQTFTVLYSFTGGSDGGNPYAGVIRGPEGNLYGTADIGGDDLNCGYSGSGCGVVYESDAAGREPVLYAFSGGLDGANPLAPVVRDEGGNIYGTTYAGGGGGCEPYQNGCGTVFKIDTAGNETVLYRFSGGSDGCEPEQGLIRNKSGALFGTTNGYFCESDGAIFRVDSAGNFTVLHTFIGGTSDGVFPWFGHLTLDRSGNLYGVTVGGGGSDDGVLYKLSKSGRFTLLHSFKGGTSDGCEPYGSVARDKAGNLYGTTRRCGSYDYGTIWKVDTTGKETILYNFAGGTADGCNPWAGVSRDAKGNLYGVTYECGASGYGALYKLSAKGKLTLLHSFDNRDGASPVGEVLRTAKGKLFGTTSYGGSIYDSGTVWSYVP